MGGRGGKLCVGLRSETNRRFVGGKVTEVLESRAGLSAMPLTTALPYTLGRYSLVGDCMQYVAHRILLLLMQRDEITSPNTEGTLSAEPDLVIQVGMRKYEAEFHHGKEAKLTAKVTSKYNRIPVQVRKTRLCS